MVVRRSATKNKNYIEKYGAFVGGLGFDFKNIEHYILAFVHRSIVNEKPDFAPEHNERLEFLGDAVLELVITNQLFRDFPEKPEGKLTDIRSALVRGRNLAVVAKQLDFGEYLILGNGERKGGGAENNYILANTVESFIGAIYLDLGYEQASTFILDHIYSTLDSILEQRLHKDAKSSLQEFIQAQFDITPHYQVLGEEGPDHAKSFTVGAYMKETLLGKGEGSSKKKAEEQAAIDACEKQMKN